MKRTTIVLLVASLPFLAPPSCKKAAPVSAGGDEHAHNHDEHAHAHADEVTLPAGAAERLGISIESAQLWMLKPTIAAPARVTLNADALAHVGSPLRGRVVELKARLGSEVKVGEELLVVESPELGEAQAELLSKRAAHANTGPAVELAHNSWQRAKTLREKSEGISLTEVERREAEYKAALATAQAAENAVASAEHRLRLLGMSREAIDALTSTGKLSPQLAITAPIKGRVIEREVTLGEIVGPDREALLVIADMSMLWVIADVPEARIADVAVGASAWITSGGRRLEGRVAFIDAGVQSDTRTARARIEVAPSDLALMPGMFVQTEIVATTRDENAAPTIAVPDAAVFIVEGASCVFVPVEGEPNTFARRAVSVGKSVAGLVPVHSGLVEGERFVAAGAFILKADLGKSTAEHEH